MRKKHIRSINFRIIYKLLVITNLAYNHKTPKYILGIPREINKAIFKSESAETTQCTSNLKKYDKRIIIQQ